MIYMALTQPTFSMTTTDPPAALVSITAAILKFGVAWAKFRQMRGSNRDVLRLCLEAAIRTEADKEYVFKVRDAMLMMVGKEGDVVVKGKRL
jgi:hypothetical protein